jgi:tetratricopeptide (TPR) repeat protein
MLPFTPSRALRLTLQSLVIVSLLLIGSVYFPPRHNLKSYLFWFGFGLLSFSWFWGAPLHAIAARWRLHARIRAILPASGQELNGLTAAALAVKQGQEERALYILENLTIRSGSSDVAKCRRWLSALASASWMARQRPGRPSSHHRFPQLQALVFSFGIQRVPLRQPALERELAEATTQDLDELAQDYISLIDTLIESLGNREMPFSSEAEDLLAFTTGRVYILGTRDRFASWWKTMRPVLTRGGGALIVGLRLVEREMFGEASMMLGTLARGGMLSAETDTLRRASSFLALFAQSQWRMTSSDIPRYFAEGYYYMAGEMGVLRFPMAELPEVVGCCLRGKVLRDSKRRLIEDSLAIWELFGDELSPSLSLLMKRLLEHKGRQCPARFSYWREQWNNRKNTFERPVAMLMDGITAVAERRLDDAARIFREVGALEPESSVPLVNLVHVLLLDKKVPEARKLADNIQIRFPTDGHALISLGRFFVAHLDDTAEAERLFTQAQSLIDPPTEALICLGEIKYMEGLYIDAQEYFSYAKQLDPELPGPKLELARVYMETKRYDLAIDNLQSVVQCGPAEARDLAHYLLYRTYREMGHDRRAFECLDKVPQKFFKEPDVLDDIAGHLEAEQRYEKAREFAERAMLLRANGGGPLDDSDLLGAF